MASLWLRMREALRERFFGSHWIEPSNEITRAVLQGARTVALPDGPIYARDERDLVFTIDELLNPALPLVANPQPATPDKDAVAAAGRTKRTSQRRAGRAA